MKKCLWFSLVLCLVSSAAKADKGDAERWYKRQLACKVYSLNKADSNLRVYVNRYGLNKECAKHLYCACPSSLENILEKATQAKEDLEELRKIKSRSCTSFGFNCGKYMAIYQELLKH